WRLLALRPKNRRKSHSSKSEAECIADYTCEIWEGEFGCSYSRLGRYGWSAAGRHAFPCIGAREFRHAAAAARRTYQKNLPLKCYSESKGVWMGSAGAAQLFREQIVALLPRLGRFAYALTRSRAEADDLIQTACERALQRVHQWSPDTRLESWMFR